MSECKKVFQVTAAPGPDSPKTIHAALAAAKESGVLAVPQEFMCLMVLSGVQVEVCDEK